MKPSSLKGDPEDEDGSPDKANQPPEYKPPMKKEVRDWRKDLDNSSSDDELPDPTEVAKRHQFKS